MSRLKLILMILFVLVIVSVTILIAENSLWLYVDGVTLILVLAIPYLAASFLYPFSEQKEIFAALFSREPGGDKKVFRKALEFFRLLKRMIVAGSVVILFIGTIGILAHLEDLDSVGRNFGVAFVTVFYCSLIMLVLIEPLIGIVRKKISQID